MEDKSTIASKKRKLIYDVLYGFVQLTPVEWEIIQTPFYQRLRWIKQLGFSQYTYPGAEHSRYGHSIGVLNNAQAILESIGKSPDIKKLVKGELDSTDLYEQQCIRISALIHDIGTFPFSHTTENAYIRYGETSQKSETKLDNHEHLGSFIIKRTDYEGGITFILKKYGIDPQRISDLVKGIDKNLLANQILHSQIDCDRMDYLLRDAHYTGLKYGAYDRDYLLNHFHAVDVGGQEVLAIHEKALNCVQDFLISRFAWYSQVVRSARGAKFDAIAEEIALYLLNENLMFKYSDLLSFIEKDPFKFFAFNDSYFLSLIQNLLTDGKLDKNLRIKGMVESLLFSKSPVSIKSDVFQQKILDQNNSSENAKILKSARDKFQELSRYLDKHGNENDWIIEDLPKKDIYLVKSEKRVIKGMTQGNVLLERDPVKILLKSGNLILLSSVEHHLISHLNKSSAFIPHVFCSPGAYDVLEKSGLL